MWIFGLFTAASASFKFLQISDVHYDPLYSTSKHANAFCHSRKLSKGDQPTYGIPESECDSPQKLVTSTFEFLKNHPFHVDVVFWTGDSSRHNRDSAHPKKKKEVRDQVAFVTRLVKETFTNTTVLPILGNWDTRVVSSSSKSDYTYLYGQWKDFWDLSQIGIVNSTFLTGGYYSYDFPAITVLGLNTLLWYNENELHNCDERSLASKHVGNIQLEWLNSQLETIKSNGRQAILIGHVPPVNPDGDPLYRTNCFNAFADIIEEHSKTIITQYYGHVNRDLAYVQTAYDGKRKYDSMYPINKITVDTLNSRELHSVFFTAPSIMPRYNPAFRLGYLKNDSSWYLDEHVQYYADIKEMNGRNSTLTYKKSCSTKDFGLSSLKVSNWAFMVTAGTNKKSGLMKKYMVCSTMHLDDPVKRYDLLIIGAVVVAILGSSFGYCVWDGYRRSAQYKLLQEEEQ